MKIRNQASHFFLDLIDHFAVSSVLRLRALLDSVSVLVNLDDMREYGQILTSLHV